MTDQPPRPTALRVIPENIPAELRALMTWCCWRYEWDGKKWTKVPYTPFTVKHAMDNKASTLRSFQAAYNCYLERPDFFDGVFLAFMKDDPFAAGDGDHSTDTSWIPNTYTEISPSGNGVRFIGLGKVPKSCKKGDRELYRHHHFLSVTGHRVEGFPENTQPIQPELDQLYEELKPSSKTREGQPGAGERSDMAAAIPESEWTEARQHQRTNMSRLLHNLRQSAISRKTHKDDTKLGFLLREDYRGFHERWPRSGIVRSDGSLDGSQIRAVMAGAIKGRGFSRPEFIALMSHFFGHECLEKWKTKQAVREEFAALWTWAHGPRTGEYVREAPTPVARGRAGDHTELLDRAYRALESFKAGTEALLTTQDLADALGTHRRTAATLLSELVADGKITYRSAYQYSGIVVTFQGGMIYSENSTSDLGHSNGSDSPFEKEPITAEEKPGVIFEKTEKSDTSHSEAQNTASFSEPITAENEAPSIYIYNQYCVSSASFDHTPISCKPDTKPCTLKDAVTEALDDLPRSQADEGTGEMKKWPVTVRRVVEFVQYEYAERGWSVKAIEFWYNKLRAARRNQMFDDLKALKRDALEKRHGNVRKEIARYERLAADDPNIELRPWWATRAAMKQGLLGQLAWELDRRDQLDKERIDKEGYSQGEQAEFMGLVEQARPPTPIPRAASVPDGMVERLRVLKQERA